jgi:hypothetical protein
VILVCFRISCFGFIHQVSKRGLVIPFVSEAPTILFGADIPHCAPEEGSRSVASVRLLSSLPVPVIFYDSFPV